MAAKITAKLVGCPFTLTNVGGEKIQETPVGRLPQLGITVPAKFVGVSRTVTGCEKELFTILTVAGDGVPKEKSGAGTLNIKDWVRTAEAPFRFPVAVTVRVGVPALVLKGTDAVTEGLDGKLLTIAGEKLHAPPAGNPAVQASATVPEPVKFVTETIVVAALEMFPAPIVIVPGVNDETVSCATCNVSGCVFVTGPAAVLEAADRVTL